MLELVNSSGVDCSYYCWMFVRDLDPIALLVIILFGLGFRLSWCIFHDARLICYVDGDVRVS